MNQEILNLPLKITYLNYLWFWITIKNVNKKDIIDVLVILVKENYSYSKRRGII